MGLTGRLREAQDKVRRLYARGWTVQDISDASGVACSTVRHLLHGDGGCPNHGTHYRIMALPDDHPRDRAATLARRLVMESSLSMRDIAAAAGVSYNSVQRVAHGDVRPTMEVSRRIVRALM